MERVILVLSLAVLASNIHGAASSSVSAKRLGRPWDSSKFQRTNDENVKRCNVDYCMSIAAKELFFGGLFPSIDNVPFELRGYFSGVSVQDYLDHGIELEVETEPYGAYRMVLNLSNKFINDLAGINNIPYIDRAVDLILSDNLLTIIPSGSFLGFENLEKLWLDDNLLKRFEAGAFIGLKNLKVLGVSGNYDLRRQDRDFAAIINSKPR